MELFIVFVYMTNVNFIIYQIIENKIQLLFTTFVWNVSLNVIYLSGVGADKCIKTRNEREEIDKKDARLQCKDYSFKH